MNIAVAVLAAWTVAAFPQVHPDHWGVDQAEILTDAEEDRIDAVIDRIHGAHGTQIAVVTADAVEGSPRQFSIDLFNRWGIGDAQRNDGMLILLVTSERRLELRTGRGLEGRFPDAWVDRMQTESMIPAFRDGRFAEGLVAGLERVERRLGNPDAGGAAAPLTDWSRTRLENQRRVEKTFVSNRTLVGALFWCVMVLLFALGWGMVRPQGRAPIRHDGPRRSGEADWDDSGGGDDFGGGGGSGGSDDWGGGSTGGGGAGNNW